MEFNFVHIQNLNIVNCMTDTDRKKTSEENAQLNATR